GRGQYKGVAITLYSPEEEENIALIEQRGYQFENVDIKNDELSPIKAHNTRQSRKNKDDHLTNELKNKVKRNKKKVKHDYQKKFQRYLEHLKRQKRIKNCKKKNRKERI